MFSSRSCPFLEGSLLWYATLRLLCSDLINKSLYNSTLIKNIIIAPPGFEPGSHGPEPYAMNMHAWPLHYGALCLRNNKGYK